MITPGLQTEIERALKGKIQMLAPLSAANNAQIYRLVMDAGRVFVAKVAERGLDTEAFMLKYLKDKSQLPVPGVFYSNEHVIIMEFVEAHYTQDIASSKHAADLLAGLHNITSDSYGFERDTLVGALKQPNPQTKDWPSFFAQHRILHMAGEAQKEGKIDAKTMKQLEKLCGKLSGYIKATGAPSLLHGDVWGGNVLFGRGKIAAFLDPAIYFGDREAELAFIRLFNTFDNNFFARYHEIHPIEKGFFEERADIYNIYPLLVHTRLFGASYARKVQKTLDRFV